ncbi:glucose/mannose transport system permease protein, partial [Candidatus Hakubella thermalkaliphila]
MVLDRSPRGEGFFRTVFLFPMSLSFIVTGTIWRWMLQPEGGLNQLPTVVGLPAGEFAWLTSRQEVWAVSWNDLPFLTALVVSVVLAFIAFNGFRDGEVRRGRIAAGSAGLLLL